MSDKFDDYRSKIDNYKAEVEAFKEKDPNGIDQHSPGAKVDAGKTRLGLVLGGFSRALYEVGDVGTFGAEKYSDNGWREVSDAESRYMDAALRHIFKHLAGESWDDESRLTHLAHAAWNILAVSELNKDKPINLVEEYYGMRDE